MNKNLINNKEYLMFDTLYVDLHDHDHVECLLPVKRTKFDFSEMKLASIEIKVKLTAKSIPN